MKEVYKPLIPTGVNECRGERVGNREVGFKDYFYSYIPTASGKIEESEWYRKCDELISEHDSEELTHLIEHHKADAVCMHMKNPQKEVRKKAIDLFMHGIHEDEEWVDFFAYNAKYNPQRLEGVETINYYTECCGIGTQTKAVHDREILIWVDKCHCHTCKALVGFKEV